MRHEGFIEFLENKGYSQHTLKSYDKVLNQFYAYLGATYKKGVEALDIVPKDIKNYLKDQLESKQKGVSTVNKELAILKSYFNYLWEKDISPVDPAVKIKRLVNKPQPVIDITFNELQSVLNKVLINPNYNSLRKAIFILAMKGLKSSDYQFKKSQVEHTLPNGKVVIHLHNRSINLEGDEAECFLEYYYISLFNGSDYVFTTTRHKSKDKVAIEVMTILSQLRAISKDYLNEYNQPLTLIVIRRAIMYYHYINGMAVQQIATLLGLQEGSVANYINTITFKEEQAKRT